MEERIEINKAFAAQVYLLEDNLSLMGITKGAIG